MDYHLHCTPEELRLIIAALKSHKERVEWRRDNLRPSGRRDERKEQIQEHQEKCNLAIDRTVELHNRIVRLIKTAQNNLPKKDGTESAVGVYNTNGGEEPQGK